MLTAGARTSATNETISLGDASHAYVGSIILHVQGSSWTGNIVPAGRVRGSGLTMMSIPYQNMRTLADVAAGTAITSDGLYAIRADGLEVEIGHTWTSGSVQIAVSALVG